MEWLSNMFVLTLPVIEKILRPIIVYIFLIIGLRLAGKRELAQLSPIDLVVLLMLANTVQNAIIGNDTSVSGGLIGAATLLIINALVVRFLYRHRKLDEMVEGTSDFLISGGRLNLPVLERELITIPELEAAARRQGVSSLDEVETARLEPGGSISFIVRLPSQDEKRQRELLRRIDQLAREVGQLRKELAGKNGNHNHSAHA
jgi:uncharacterized membrane protein YcaP (DUF421 family)